MKFCLTTYLIVIVIWTRVKQNLKEIRELTHP